jgi:hypothetical protein
MGYDLAVSPGIVTFMQQSDTDMALAQPSFSAGKPTSLLAGAVRKIQFL